ncbi:MAG: hypothetical protein HQK89_14795 [Nitrospirae bacterium]|nr:hypothetical protein [Nitrospirota bacterium]
MESQLKELKEIVLNGFKKVENKFDSIDKRFDRMEGRLENVEGRLDHIDKELADVKVELADVKVELAQKPDRDEVRLIVHDEIRSYPYSHVLDKSRYDLLDWKSLKIW